MVLGKKSLVPFGNEGFKAIIKLEIGGKIMQLDSLSKPISWSGKF
tara:strand:+ start:4715 stop:4849 length:135 start_codon:yes stop_codon:yes gene_type:complete